MSDDKVIPIAPKLNRATKPLLEVVRETTCLCTFRVDKRTRTVRCPKCDRVWDAFDALDRLASDFTRYAANRDAIKREMSELGDKRDKLRKEISALKSKLRRTKENAVREATATLEHLADRPLSREDA